MMKIRGNNNCSKCRHIYCQSRDRGIACNYYSQRKEDYIEHSRNSSNDDTINHCSDSNIAMGQGSTNQEEI